MEREACVCDHGFERSDLCAEIIIIIIINMVHRHLIFSFVYWYNRQVLLLLMICIYV